MRSQQGKPVTDTAPVSVPVFTSAGRSGFGSQLSTPHESGGARGHPALHGISRCPPQHVETDKELPRCEDTEESGVLILSGAEDLVPVLVEEESQWDRHVFGRESGDGVENNIHRSWPRIEGLFARTGRWANVLTGRMRWRTMSRRHGLTGGIPLLLLAVTFLSSCCVPEEPAVEPHVSVYPAGDMLLYGSYDDTFVRDPDICTDFDRDRYPNYYNVVTVENDGNTTVSVTDVSIGPDNEWCDASHCMGNSFRATVCGSLPLQLSPGDSLTIIVRCTSSRQSSGTLIIHTDAEGFSQLEKLLQGKIFISSWEGF